MKLLRFGPSGQEKPGILDRDGRIRDLSGTVSDIGPDAISPASLDKLRRIDPATLPAVAGTPRIGPCVARVSKLLCVGLNYRLHAQETGAPIPKEPILFLKATTAINGPNDDVVIPKNSKKTDWEVELGVVIGSKAQYVSEADAVKHVAGYCIVNDISEREFQIERGGQWSKGKSCDTFAPMGPYLVTSDEVRDPQALDLFCEVSGQRVQGSNTNDMIFTVKQLVSYASQFMTLLPGDVIPTGTPSGVGLGRTPQVWLAPGDELVSYIAGIGELRQRFVAARPS